jgi:hypothetical protein
VRAFKGHDGTLRVVIVNEDPPGTIPVALRLRVGRRYRSATALTLTARSPTTSTGVRLGGRAVARDGSWVEPAARARIASRASAISVIVSPSSAQLLTLPPAGGPRLR